MSKAYWNDEWPNLNNISIALPPDAGALSAAEVGILYRLLWFSATRVVHSAYSTPTGVMGFPAGNTEAICRIAGCGRAEWHSASAAVLQYFRAEGGNWVVADEGLIRISKPGRQALPASVQELVSQRDGEQCVYCGDRIGPFHFDHLWPVSKGGSSDPANLVKACADCNLSKGGKTLVEWMGGKK